MKNSSKFFKNIVGLVSSTIISDMQNHFFSTYTDTGTGSFGSNSGCEDHFSQSDYFDGELKYVHSAFKTHQFTLSFLDR